MDQKALFVDMALKAWNSYVKNTDKLIDSLTDEALLYEIAPGKNRIVYLLGHLVAIHDNMISLFGLGNRSYAHFDDPFLKNADRTTASLPTPAELRDDWKKLNVQLTELFEKMSTDDWFGPHSAVSAEDFEREPYRNKLNVLLNRTNHLAYHYGQMILVKKTAGRDD